MQTPALLWTTAQWHTVEEMVPEPITRFDFGQHAKMNEKTFRALKAGAELLPVEELDVGLMQRGGMLPIVGLGGSAGGIAALQDFFATMPADSGMAFVVILHLSPTLDSTLAEMFQRSTTMPVSVATDGATVEPNSVYVIPPGKFLSSVNGHLRLSEAVEPRGKRVAIDYFFRSLAETHGTQSLAIVLSGAGGDGALGLKRIKELGGLTIAQDPHEAEHHDMPRSAIATGVVDWVLKVKEMPAKLIEYVKQREELKLPGEDGPHPAETVQISANQHETALRDLLTFLHTRTGRDFSYYKRATILRRIARRMQVNGLADLPSYLVYLRTHAGEAGSLLQDLLISVTNFFRDPASFAALERKIQELFTGKEAGDTVRVWVAGCATGEEAYSIAILLSEHAEKLVGPPQLQVFATDLDEEVIREAREGLYPETIAADVSEERLRHFFIHEHGGYRVRRAVRELVLFAPHDLLKDSPFSRLDLVSCRNLLIYLKREAQNRALDIFHFSLRPGGLLFLGTSEAVDEGSQLFAVLDKKQRLFVHRSGPQRLIAVPTGPGTLARALAVQERMRERPTPGRVPGESVSATILGQPFSFNSGLTPGELHYRLIEHFSPPSILVNAAYEIIHLSESAGRYLQIAGGEPTRDLLRSVHPMLRVELRAGLYAAAHSHVTSIASRIPFEAGDMHSVVDIRITPTDDLAPDFLLVVFEEHPVDGAHTISAPTIADADQAALHLERELVETKAHLRYTIEESEASTEELKASNEELQAMNEELRAATEELETSREELQSINEELTMVNDELKSNVDQLARSNNDLQNLMSATDIATVFLDRKLCIQRFTPSAKALFSFITTDLGRPLSDLSRHLDYPELVADAERSLSHLQPSQREVRAGMQWYIARILPYRTADDHIAGVVLTFLDITEQKRAEEEIIRLGANSERQRRLYETVLSNTPDFIYVFSLEHKVIYANDALIKMWGRGRDGAIGKTFLEIGYETWHAEMHDREIDQVRDTRQPIRGEVAFTGTNGKRQYDYIFAPIIGDDGEVEAVTGTTRDVTERKEKEDQLQRNHDTFFALIENNPFGVYVVDADFRLRQVSIGAQKVFDTVRPLLGRDFAEILRILWPETFASEAIDRFRYTLDTGESYSAPSTIERRADSGTLEAYDWRIERISMPDGRYGVVCYFYDLSERQRWEATLRDSEERLRLATNAAELGIWTWQPDEDSVVWENDRPYEIFALARNEPPITAHRFKTEFLHLEDIETFETAFGFTQRTRAPLSCECRIRRTDGETRWVEFTGRVVDNEEKIRLIGTVQDITERKKAEDAIRASEARNSFMVRLTDALRGLSNSDEVRAAATLALGQFLGANRVLYFEARGDDYVVEQDYTDATTSIVGRYSIASFGAVQLALYRGGQTTVETDVTLEPSHTVSEREAFAALQIRSYVGVPLIKGGAFVAGLAAHSAQARVWTPTEIAIIEETAERTWDAIERARAETALRQSEERSAFVRASTGVGFWYCDLPFDILEWDELVKSHFHLPPDAVITIQTFYDRLHPDDREPTRKAIELSIAGLTNYSVIYRTVNPETEAVTWVRAIGRTFYSSEGTPTRFDGVTLDVSDQMQSEAKLRESEQRFREMANAAPAMIWVTNEKHECTFLSQSWFTFTGQTNEEGLGFGWIDGVHPDDRASIQTTFLAAAEKVEAFELDYRLRSVNGNYRWVIDAGKPRFNEAGAFCGFVGSVIDDHDRHEIQLALNEARQAAEAANASKSAFLANMSHEIRTPMTAILGYADLLNDLVHQNDAIQHLKTIRRNGSYLLDIINDILDLSKIEAGKLSIEFERFEPHQLIEDVRSIMEVRAKEGGLILEVHYDGMLPEVIESDAKRLKQILINLVGNAIKFTHTGKVQIRVRFHRETRQLLFDVLDTGIGISTEQMERLFKPFSQGDASVARNFGGTGLGLVISQRLAEMLDGSITVSSSEGIGSMFSLSIATGECAEQNLIDYVSMYENIGVQLAICASEPTTLACHVLIVDDRRDIRFLSRHILTKAGATVSECEDGLIAVEHISTCLREGNCPDLVLLDMQMPNLDGYATAQRLRSLGYTGPILALTADAMQSDMNRCIKVGCNDYLSKPIDRAQLLTKVVELTKVEET